MADLTARPDSWTDYLPGDWQQSINTSPLLNALRSAMNRPTPDMTRGIEHDQYGSVSDRNWLLQQAAGGPPKLNPLATEMLDKGGLLANFLGPGVKLPATAPKPTGIRAYHGSPHDFDRFDINKIGTGEGAQAYGRGLYFAESEGVAKSYRDNLAEMHDAGRPGSSMAHILLRQHGGNREAAIQDAIAGQKSFSPGLIKKGDPVGVMRFREAEEVLRSDWQPPKGRMYEVRINADPEQFLDWDKPLAQQPEAVRKALPVIQEKAVEARKAAKPGTFSDADLAYLRSPELTVDDLLRVLGNDLPSLRDAGIPGVKYLDQMSRGKGEGSRNYAVWDDKLIEILRKYGLLPPVAAGTAAAMNQQEPPL